MLVRFGGVANQCEIGALGLKRIPKWRDEFGELGLEKHLAEGRRGGPLGQAREIGNPKHPPRSGRDDGKRIEGVGTILRDPP